MQINMKICELGTINFDNKRAFSKRFLKQYVWVIFFDSNIMHNDIIISIIQY